MFTAPPAYLPVHQDSTGQLRVAGTRVTLDTVVHAHLGGASAEEIVRRYPSLPLAAVYATVGYYLHHCDEFDRYLDAQEEAAAEVRRQVTARQGPQDGLKARLLARLAAREPAEGADAVPGR